MIEKIKKFGIPHDASTQKNFLLEGKDVYFVDNDKIYSLEQYKNKLTSSRGAGSTMESGT
jgi:tRNA A-37 threonylcarbamoyl transferase component Bud32